MFIRLDIKYFINHSFNDNNMLNRKDKNTIALLGLLFFFIIFLPPLISISMRVIVSLLNICIIFYFLFTHKNITVSRRIIKSLSGIFIFITYAYLNGLIKILIGENVASVTNEMLSFTLTIFHTFVACYAFSLLRMKKKITYETFVYSLIFATILQLILVIMAFVIPSIKILFQNMMIRNAKSESVSKALARYGYLRGYGLAYNIFDAFGYICAILILITFTIAIYQKRRGLLLIALIMTVMPLLNARTGIMLVGIGIIIILSYNYTHKKFFSYLIYLFIVIIIGYIGFQKLPEVIQKWLILGIEQTKILITTGEAIGVYGEILGNDFVFPTDVIFGLACSPDSIGLYGIDNGYVQCIWRYGIVGLILLALGVLHFIKSGLKMSNNKEQKCIMLLLLSMFFIYLVKLYSLTNTGSIFLIISVVETIIYETSNFNKSKDRYNNQIEKEK